VRPERPGDHDAVREVVRAAFGEDGVAVLLDDLRTSPAWLDLSFVAELGTEIGGETGSEADGETAGEVVGHVSLSRAWVDDPRAVVDVLVLSPLSVRPERQRAGIGTALVAAALAAAAERDEPLVFLEGDPRYYSRLGFVAAGPLGFSAPSPRIPAAAFQVWPTPAYRGGLTGALVYPDVFWRHDAVGLRP
jgi:putative acetyltransferase